MSAQTGQCMATPHWSNLAARSRTTAHGIATKGLWHQSTNHSGFVRGCVSVARVVRANSGSACRGSSRSYHLVTTWQVKRLFSRSESVKLREFAFDNLRSRLQLIPCLWTSFSYCSVQLCYFLSTCVLIVGMGLSGRSRWLILNSWWSWAIRWVSLQVWYG